MLGRVIGAGNARLAHTGEPFIGNVPPAPCEMRRAGLANAGIVKRGRVRLDPRAGSGKPVGIGGV